MEIQASAKFIRLSPKKARPLLARLRGMKTADALVLLKYHRSKTSQVVHKLIHSAVSNAKNNYNFKEDNLKIKSLTVDDGPMFKRYWFRSRGSADRLLKRTGHFQIVLAEIDPTVIKKTVTPSQASKPARSKDDNQDTVKPAGIKPQPSASKPKGGTLRKIFTRRTTNK